MIRGGEEDALGVGVLLFLGALIWLGTGLKWLLVANRSLKRESWIEIPFVWQFLAQHGVIVFLTDQLHCGVLPDKLCLLLTAEEMHEMEDMGEVEVWGDDERLKLMWKTLNADGPIPLLDPDTLIHEVGAPEEHENLLRERQVGVMLRGAE